MSETGKTEDNYLTCFRMAATSLIKENLPLI